MHPRPLARRVVGSAMAALPRRVAAPRLPPRPLAATHPPHPSPSATPAVAPPVTCSAPCAARLVNFLVLLRTSHSAPRDPLDLTRDRRSASPSLSRASSQSR